MYYSGFADEASGSIDGQIRATKELGWSHIESRGVDGSNLAYLDDNAFDLMREKLSVSGVSIDCYGSAVANWAKDPRKPEDYEKSLDELRKALPRMDRLGIRQIRAMSFVIVRDALPDSAEIEAQVFPKVKEMVRICADHGVTWLQENCQNYGGLSWKHSLRLAEAVDHPSFRLVFDTGNPVGTPDWSKPEPRPRQRSWEFFDKVRSLVDRVHIKDAVFRKETGGTFPELDHRFPGDGDGDVERIIRDLVRTGFKGALSIEPHMAVVHHDGSKKSDDEIRFDTYVAYGRRLMELVRKTENS